MKHTRILLLITLLCAAMASSQTVHAATITVTSPWDSGGGSLRQALTDANDGDTIDFGFAAYPAPIWLDSPLVVDKSVTISGPGAANLYVIGPGYCRVFYINRSLTVTISGVTIDNGYDDGVGGAGIYNDHSTLTVSNCDIHGNLAVGNGGAIYNNGSEGSATLTINNSYFGGNQAGYYGGAIYNDSSVGSATVTINSSTLRYNSAGSFGGGIANHALETMATVIVTNSTLSDNSAYYGAGGIYNTADGHGSGTLTITNSTLSGNSASAPYGGGGIGGGGGIVNVAEDASVTLTITNSTLSGNSASVGGGIYNGANRAATLTIGDTILKTGDSGENIWSDPGDVISLGYNLSDDDGGGFLTATGDQINTDPMLGPLQDNGGPTFTHELLTGSPAIDAGDPNFTPPPDYDQRGSGFQRVVNNRIDIGAFEVQPVTSSYAAQVQAPINPDGSSTFSVRRGVVPVKFNLTQGGVATCDLPPATIAVTRTAGGVVGQVNESDYSGNADTGSNFRIDSCQYVYNLNSRALGVGTYRVDILIDDQVVGSAVFSLN
jgi:hypothetical protein